MSAPNRVRIQSMITNNQEVIVKAIMFRYFMLAPSSTDLSCMSLTVYSGRSAFSQGTRQEINFNLSI